MDGHDNGNVRAIQRAIAILEQLSRHGGLGITELAEKVDLSVSTVHRLLATMKESDVVRQDMTTGRYRLGFKLMEFGAAAIRSVELRSTARPHLEALARNTSCTTHLASLDHGEVVYLDKIDAGGPLRLFSQVGRRAPWHCTGLGKCLAAYLSPAEQQRLLAKPLRRFTARTITEPERMAQHLRQIAEQGYAVDDSEHEELIHCLAVPVRAQTGAVVAAISAVTICAEFLPNVKEHMLRELLKAAGAISYEIGFPSPADDH